MRADTVADGRADRLAERGFGLRTPAIAEIGVARIGERAAALPAILEKSPPAARRNRLDVTLPGQRRRHAAPSQEGDDPGRRRPVVDERRGEQRVDLGGKGHAGWRRRRVERLDSESIARQEKRAILPVPACEREHPAYARQ